ncbi:MAG: SUMF1/EgtB/PvdO family nonheme iron enzyme [Kiritimatiellae bacterium]|nr:SUMF1/EgtB/PvdO family nonheme iron enzyme [Kiritimatiellia bacterium]
MKNGQAKWRAWAAAAGMSVLAGGAWGVELPWVWEGEMEFGGDRTEWVVDLEGAPERVEVRLAGGGGAFAVNEASWDGAWNGTPLGRWESGTGDWTETRLAPDAVTRHLRFRAEGGTWVLTGVRVDGGDGEVRVVFDREDGFAVEEGAEEAEIRAQVVNGGGGWFGEDAWECDEGAGRGDGAVFWVDTGAVGWHWARVRAGCDGNGEEVSGAIRWRVGEAAGGPPALPEAGKTAGGASAIPAASAGERSVSPRATVEDYYDACYGADGRLFSGAELKAALCAIVNAGTKTNGYGSLDAMLRVTDACPTNEAMVQCIYLQRGITNFNKEHLWAQSHGIDGKSPAYSDLHHLRASDSAMNAARGNLDFDDCRGLSGAKEKNGNWYTTSAWEPPDSAKGDVARALFYVDVRYEPGSTPVGDLELVEAVGTGTESNVLGRLSTLLEWNELDPPDEFETRRNELIAGTYQGNRNPFVDHPEWARAVFDPEHWEGGGKAATVEVSGLEARQRYPWNALVDIDYTVACDPEGTLAEVSVRGVDGETGETVEMRSLEGDGAAGPVGAGTHRLTWDLGTDAPELASDAFAVRMLVAPATPQYLVVDLSGGPEAESWPVWTLEGAPAEGWGGEHKTDKLVLRRVEAGTFSMGSPVGELGRAPDETRHEVALTEGFWMGVFETTQRQWELATGGKPSAWTGASHPVERITHGEAEAFLETLAAKTGLAFGLPTEAQWEYACRAGTTNALHSGRDLTGTTTCPRLARLGRYAGNTNDAAGDGAVRHAAAGSYRPNAWGLHDMHGNVEEWCRDWYGAYGSAPATDPAGAAFGSQRVARGGGWKSAAQACRSGGRRIRYAPDTRGDALGVRAACTAGGEESGARAQRIVFEAIGPQTATSRVALAAVASSWKPVAFEVASGPAEMDGETLVCRAGGTVVVAAIQSGGGGWMAARAEQTVEVARAPQELWFEPIGTQTATSRVELAATATGGGPVAFSVVSGPGIVEGNILTFTGAGRVELLATQAGDGTWLPAEALQTLEVTENAVDALYLVVDMSGGAAAESWPVERLSAAPQGGWMDEHKRSKLVLRRIEAGTYVMGAPEGEPGSTALYERQRTVVLTDPHYIGVFEVTQEQWELATGGNPSEYAGPARPVERVSYDDIRGASAGTNWPASAEVDAESFMGVLRAKTSLAFDLPTEAQWEHACRAGTTTGFNSGKEATGTIGADPAMAELGRYDCNSGFGGYAQYPCDGVGGTTYAHTTVGSYLPNAWSLYDMHGNVGEWCLDWREGIRGTATVTNPAGPRESPYGQRLVRGGNWTVAASKCRSASSGIGVPSLASNGVGFRLSCAAGGCLLFPKIGPRQCDERVPLFAVVGANDGEAAFAVESGPGAIEDGVLSFTGPGEVVVSARLPAAGELAAQCAMQTVSVSKATATVTVNGRIAVFDGTPKSVRVETEPPGLPVSVSYDGADGQPSAVGLHAVSVAVVDARYQGVAQCPMAIVEENSYLAVDLDGGTAPGGGGWEYFSTVPEGGWTDEYKTDKILMRLISPGTFFMGSPTNEWARRQEETQHTVTLTRHFFMGVFEVTYKQWEWVTGDGIPWATEGNQPRKDVSYTALRGRNGGLAWPSRNVVDDGSFLARLRAKTGLAFDLPTEAQWEYACRAGTTGLYNNGQSATNWQEARLILAELGRFSSNSSDGAGGHNQSPTTVGCYRPNAWGLYDMHGNVFEWCLDVFEAFDETPKTDPVGPFPESSRSYRVGRGGSWREGERDCRCATRQGQDPAMTYWSTSVLGFRLALPLADENEENGGP